MNIQLKRRYLGEGYTIGTLSIDGQYFCDTLEDAVRQVKVYGKTAIPYGRYNIILNVSPHFGRILPRLIDVPQFEGVLIHRGNTAEDTAGCILVGENKVKGKVINSTPYEIGLVKMMHEAIDRGEKITIEII
jgi:hypothetical protein